MKNIGMILAMVMGSILLFLTGNIEFYAQGANNNNTFTKIAECFVHPCVNATKSQNVTTAPKIIANLTTALIGVSFNNVTLKDLQDNKDVINL